MDDLISRQAAIDAFMDAVNDVGVLDADDINTIFQMLPSAQPKLYGYNIEHLKFIATILQKEGLTPERVKEALVDMDRIFVLVKDEFEKALKTSLGVLE